MATTHQIHRRRPRDRDGIESLAFRIPATAASFDGFCAWALSKDRPRQVKLGYLGGTIYLEMPGHVPAIELPASAIASLEGFCDWYCSDAAPARGRFTFLREAVIVDMSPEELETHSKVKDALFRTISRINDDEELGEFFPDGVLVTNPATGLSQEPDGTFVKWQTVQSGRVVYRARRHKENEFIEIRGVPDWVAEVVSRSSVAKDKRDLREEYYEAGIGEYWLIDARGYGIDFQILLRGPDDYVRSKPRAGWHFSEVFGRWFRLTRRRNRAGRWQYRLEVKAE